MPTCVQEIGLATAAMTRGQGRTTTVVRVSADPPAVADGAGPTAQFVASERDQRVLAAVDGERSLRSLVDVAGMSETELLTTVDRLVDLGILALR